MTLLRRALERARVACASGLSALRRRLAGDAGQFGLHRGAECFLDQLRVAFAGGSARFGGGGWFEG